ncbi:MAG: hypothetical protein DRI34_08285 [Deltaproteobacteria bacterium]|nr:MAG: hypothetical protein DRI34_08285 [Deltaproteobacteria bacterium]
MVSGKTRKNDEQYYVVTYRDPVEDKIVSLKARRIGDSSLGLAFVCISEFIFETSPLLVNPDEEAMKKKFADIHSLHLSIYSIVSIAEVGGSHQGLKFTKDKSNLVVLPNPSDKGEGGR